MIRSTRVSVSGTVPTLIVEADDDATRVTVTNAGAANVVLGDSTVAATAGYTLGLGTALPLNLYSHESLYGIVASGTAVVHVLKTSAT